MNYPVGYVMDGNPPCIWSGGKWLPCDGSLVSRKEYPELYQLVGVMYTDEDERCCTSELFQLPDLREKDGNGRKVS